MRRPMLVPASSLAFFTLLVAPFIHIHFGSEVARSLQDIESRGAVVHAHFGEEPDDSVNRNGRRAELDHSPHKAKPFVSSALRPTNSILEKPICEAATPGSVPPVAVSPAPGVLADAPSIHGPPGLPRPALRAPPAYNPA